MYSGTSKKIFGSRTLQSRVDMWYVTMFHVEALEGYMWYVINVPRGTPHNLKIKSLRSKKEKKKKRKSLRQPHEMLDNRLHR
jgi:hypothetical protein